MDRTLIVHALAFLYLCLVVSLSLSCYREENISRIIKETARRSLKFVVFIGVLAGAVYGLERAFVDY